MQKDDRLVPLVYFSFVPLAILTAIFGPVLVLFPDSTQGYWSWEIKPAMSTVWLGASYAFGAIAIVTMLVVGKWRVAIVPIIGTWMFSLVVCAATLIHLDRFFLGTINFYVWFAIYMLLPVVLPVIWWLNRNQDPGPQPDDLLISRTMAVTAGGAGVVFGLLSLVLIFSPSTADAFWPWALTPLVSRIIGAWLLFIATGLVCLLFERRYLAYRYYLLPASFWFALFFVASFFHLDNFDFNRITTYVWFALTVGASLAAVGAFLLLESRYRAGQRQVLVTGAQA
ncbi:MAG TPA: hypothetical protein VLQ48_06410 [Chloroflexia bacterium]|nr:hypothetical protein [Chloroflexia bacterium]